MASARKRYKTAEVTRMLQDDDFISENDSADDSSDTELYDLSSESDDDDAATASSDDYHNQLFNQLMRRLMAGS